MTHINTFAKHQATAEPQGGRIGVAFDWGFGVQLASMGLLSLVGAPLPGGMPTGVLPGLGMLGVAAVAFAQGEALRRGKGWARYVQIAGNGTLAVGGLLALPVFWQQLQDGNWVSLYTYALLVGVSPAEVWLLLQPGSQQWYGTVSDEEALARHSGPWLTGTVAWAVACGLLQTAVSYVQRAPMA